MSYSQRSLSAPLASVPPEIRSFRSIRIWKTGNTEMIVKVVCQIAPPAFALGVGGPPVGESGVQVTCVVQASPAAPLHASLPCQRSFLSPGDEPFLFPPKSRKVVESTGTRVTPVLQPMPPAALLKAPLGSPVAPVQGKAVFFAALVFGEL